ncbi:MAG: hemerythrin domain-containing protein [Bacteroidota bacterium]
MKTNLIKELKAEHKKIVQTFNKVNELGIGSKKGQNELLAVKQYLLDHLKKEDEYIYPFLKEAAKKNVYIKQTLKSFADDMDKISALAIDFFDKYTQGGEGMEFEKDFDSFCSKLSMRIRKEETVLYDLYNSLHQ